MVIQCDLPLNSSFKFWADGFRLKAHFKGAYLWGVWGLGGIIHLASVKHAVKPRFQDPWNEAEPAPIRQVIQPFRRKNF